MNQKEYNSKYYAENRSHLLQRACEKVECELCGRSVIRNNVLKHYKSKLCHNKTQLKKELDARK